MNLKDFFETELNQKLQQNDKALSRVESSFQLNIDDYACYLDLKKERQIFSGTHPQPDCSIQMSKKDFEKMLEGKLNIPLALAMRKIKVSGDLLLFAKLRELFVS